MSAYRSSWISAAPIDDYFSNLPAITTHDFIDSDTLSHHMTGEDRGTPTVGIYANDGLWDEEDSEISTTRFSSSAATSSIKTKGGSMKSRSNRSGTASPFPPEEEKSGMWGWVQRGRDSPQSTDVKPLSKKESKAKLRGMGRRGELMVVVDPEGCSPPPVPPTPSSYLQTPVTASPAFFSPPSHASQHDENDPSSKSKGSWKKGVQRIFRSKSSAALREISNSSNAPPVPIVPSALPKHALGKPFSSSTPPPSVKRPGVDKSPASLSAARQSYGLYPSFPADPFESRLDFSSRGLEADSFTPPPPRLPRHSPSLKSLKDFITPSKTKLSKSKSFANIKEPASAPPIQTEFPPLPEPPRRMTSLSSLRQGIRNSLASVLPVESPPLLPPNPPYFPPTSVSPPSTLSSTPSLTILTSFPLPTEAAPSSPAPDAPLPPLPLPKSQPLSSDIPRSGSAKLLPRSRSTSMSLRSPPTSSSFFDLYEQLGIWPTPEKDESTVKIAKRNSSPTKLGRSAVEPLSNSSSGAFSAASWEAAINAFPVVDHIQSRFSMDILAAAGGDLTMDTLASHVAVASSASSTRTHTNASNCTAGPSRTRESVPLQPDSRSRRGRQRRSGGGSNASSRNSSRERKPSIRREGQWDGEWSSDSSEEDDVPLSKLHPSAVIAQQEKKERAIQRRADRFKAKANQIKLVGRNPGGDTGWNGEGGVPARALTEKLERLLIPRPSPSSATPSDYPWAAAGRSPRVREATQPIMQQQQASAVQFAQSQPHQRSHTEPIRSMTQRSARPVAGTITTSPQMMMNDDRLPSPMMGPSRTTSTRQDFSAPPSRPAEMTREPSSASTHTQAAISRLPPPVPQDYSAHSRSNTSSSRRSHSRARSRSNSTAKHGLASDENMIRVTAATEPMPALHKAMHVRAFIGSLEGKKVTLEIFPETTPKDVIAEAGRNEELDPLGRGMSWVVMEMFSEIGCERLVREYEQLQTIVRGWDTTAKYNCLILKQTINGASTWQKSISTTAPYLGSWVQYESKKGKWSKRWLETRGGQVFLAKNEKSKDEVQINTLFFDIYHMTRPYPGPKPFVFVMKRVDPEASFQNPEDYRHTFSAEDGVGYKLMAAIFDAKSFALQPHLLARQQGHGQQGSTTMMRKPTIPSNGPLVSLVESRKVKEEKTGFTGKGLLRL